MQHWQSHWHCAQTYANRRFSTRCGHVLPNRSALSTLIRAQSHPAFINNVLLAQFSQFKARDSVRFMDKKSTMSIAHRHNTNTNDETSFIPVAVESLTMQSKALATVASYLGSELDDAVKLILGCKGRVIITGMGKSGIVGKKIAATFASTGTPSFYVHPGEAIHGDPVSYTHLTLPTILLV